MIEKRNAKENIRQSVRDALINIGNQRTAYGILSDQLTKTKDKMKINEERRRSGDSGLKNYAENFANHSMKFLEYTYAKLEAQTRYLKANANLERLLLENQQYLNLEKNVPEQVPQDHLWWTDFILANQEEDGYEIEKFRIATTGIYLDIEEGHLMFNEDEVLANNVLEYFEHGKWRILSTGKIELTFKYKNRSFVALGSVTKTGFLVADDVTFRLKIFEDAAEGKNRREVGYLELTD